MALKKKCFFWIQPGLKWFYLLKISIFLTFLIDLVCSWLTGMCLVVTFFYKFIKNTIFLVHWGCSKNLNIGTNAEEGASVLV